MSKLTGAVVEWFEYAKDGKGEYVLTKVGTGTFLAFGSASDSHGPGEFTTWDTAIIRKSDGGVITVPADNVKLPMGINNHTPEGKEQEYMASMINDGS